MKQLRRIAKVTLQQFYQMKKLFLFTLLLTITVCKSQNPGLIISEVLANPAGTDTCREYVELLALKPINFSLTPYTVIVNNNGTATNLGWVNGGSITYAFAINSGSVNTGDVVYVGGSCMTPTTGQLRTINVKYQNGDYGIGTANSAGVFGNGGSNVDGIAVFNLPVSTINASTVPVDALFYGTGIGSALVNGGADGYQLPNNEFYNGGKLTNSSYYTSDPGSDILLTASGIYNLSSASWSISRSISTGTQTSAGTCSITLITTGTVAPGTISFVSNDTTVSEGSSSATIYLKLTASTTATSSIKVYATALSNVGATDYTLSSQTYTFPASAAINSTAAINIQINNDNISESTEYLILKMYDPQNLSIGSISQFAFYINDNDKPIPQPSNSLSMTLLGSFSNTVSGSNSAEIVAHDPSTQRLYIANSIGAKLDIVDFSNPSSPLLLTSVPISTYGNINSVAVKNGTVALAIENVNPQDSGYVVFMNSSGNYLSKVKVGVMPDMITFNHAGTKVLTANEGEPNSSYTNDPDGSISIINISNGVNALSQNMVSHITFTALNGTETSLRSQGIRIYGLNATASKDFEPEYITVTPDDTKAYVTLQENNAVVEINLSSSTITNIRALGTKDYSNTNSGFDVSNVTKGINISNFPVKGFYLPDAIASYTVNGNTYYITANEGDARAYSGYSEEFRVNQLNLDPSKFYLGNELKNNYVLGRLTVTNANGDSDNDGDIDTIYCMGGRSFSIWNASNGQLVYDSKDDFEQITASNSYSTMFNASNTSITKKDRSDDKGPEPEGVAIGTVGNSIYAFIALERIGGVMVYDVTTPNNPVFVTYVNNRNLSSNGPDRGAEGILFIPQQLSPNGMHIVIAANEVSSSLSIWGIPGCNQPLNSVISTTGTTTGVCSQLSPTLAVPQNTNAVYQWSVNGNAISGATNYSLITYNSGQYNVSISSGTNCFTQSLNKSITIYPNPTITIAGNLTICAGSIGTLTASGAVNYTWSNNATSPTFTFNSNTPTTVQVTGSTTNNCSASLTRTINVSPQPTIQINGANGLCNGESTTLTASGADFLIWSNGASGTITSITPSATGTYTVFGTTTLNCTSVAVKTLTVFPTPTITVISPTQLCSGETVTLQASGGLTYNWSNGQTGSSITLTPLASTIITVNGLNAENCSASASTNLIVDPCTSINSNIDHKLTIYPNPNTGVFYIQTNSQNVELIEITSLSGALIKKLEQHSTTIPIDVQFLDKGIYIIRISDGSDRFIQRLIIQ